MTIAITREVSSRFNECEITHIDRTSIDLGVARQQHHDYLAALSRLGCEVIPLPEEPDLPDSVFVEDAAFILPEVAVITRPGADSRKPETESVARALAPYRKLLNITAPASVDGGDILIMGRNIYVGLSTRSNQNAIDQMNSLLGDYGYKATGVQMHDCLHLKTAATRVDDTTLLINRKWVDTHHLKAYTWIEIDESEAFAANCLPVNGQIIYPTSFPKTCEKLEAAGHKILPVTVDELAKAEGAVTCCSLIIN
jgi:dimethylargininase